MKSKAATLLLSLIGIAIGAQASTMQPTMTELGNDTIALDDIEESDNDTVGKSRLNTANNFNALRYVLDKRYHGHGDQFTKRLNDHLYILFGLGTTQMVAPEKGYRFNTLTTIQLGAGKEFTEYHSVRVILQNSFGYQQDRDISFNRLGATVDHLFSLSSYFTGYDPTRLADFSTLVGVGVHHSRLGKDIRSGMSAEVHLGMQVKFFTGPQGYINFEPYFGFSTDKMDLNTNRNWRKTDMFYGANISYVYYLHNNLSAQARLRYMSKVPDDIILSENLEPASWRVPWIAEFSTGISMISSPTLGIGQTLGSNIAVGVGKWFSPVVGLRLTGELSSTRWNQEPIKLGTDDNIYTQNLNNVYAGVRAEAMFNPLGFLKDFDWDSDMGAYLVAGGMYGRMVKYQAERLNCNSEAYTAGIHLWKKLGNGLQLFVEPRYTHYVYNIPYSNVKWNKSFSDDGLNVNVGLTVLTCGKAFRRQTGRDEQKAVTMKNRLSVGVAGGFNITHTKTSLDGASSIPWNAMIFGEYNFNTISSLNASFEYLTISGRTLGKYYDLNMMAEEPEKTRISANGLLGHEYSLGLLSVGYGIDLGSLFVGFSGSNRFGVNIIAGPTAIFTLSHSSSLDGTQPVRKGHVIEIAENPKTKLGIGAHAGLQLHYQLNNKIALVAKPVIYMLGTTDMKTIDFQKGRIIESINIGVRYSFNTHVTKQMYR